MTTLAQSRVDRGPAVGDVLLRLLVVAGLGISAYVHLHLAHLYRGVGDSITMADLFYVQGGVAIAVAAWLLVTGMRSAWWLAGVVGLASFAAVMVYRYVDVGVIGPIPNMYDASWQPAPDKLLSAVAEAAVAALVLGRLLIRGHRGGARRRADGS